MSRGYEHWAERSPQRAVSPSSFFGKCFHDGPRIQHVPSAVAASVPPVSASLPGRLWGSVPLSPACRLRLGGQKGLAAQFPSSDGPLEEGLQVRVQSSPLRRQLVREGEQHASPQSARDWYEQSNSAAFTWMDDELVKEQWQRFFPYSAQCSAADCFCHSQPRTQRHHPSELGASSTRHPQWHHPGLRGNAAELKVQIQLLYLRLKWESEKEKCVFVEKKTFFFFYHFDN